MYALLAVVVLAPQADTIHAVQIARFGGEVQAEAPLSWINGIARAPSGHVIALGKDDSRVVEFDAEGAFVRTVASEGDGPGEVQLPHFTGYLGDTLWIVDSGLRRATLFLDGRVVRTARVEIPGNLPETIDDFLGSPFAPAVPYLLIDGNMVGRPVPDDMALEQQPGEEAPWPLYHISGSDTVIIAAPRIGRVRSRVQVLPRGWTRLPKPAQLAPLFDVSNNSSFWALVTQTPGDEGTFEVTVLFGDVEANRRDTLRMTLRGPRLEEPDRTAYAREWAERLQLNPAISEGVDAVMERIRAQVDFPRIAPPFSGVMVGDDGSIWLRSGKLSRRFEWLRVSGESRDLVILPVEAELHVGDERALFGITRDDLGLHWVVSFSLER